MINYKAFEIGSLSSFSELGSRNKKWVIKRVTEHFLRKETDTDEKRERGRKVNGLVDMKATGMTRLI